MRTSGTFQNVLELGDIAALWRMPRETELGVAVNSRHSLSLSFPICTVDSRDPWDAFDWNQPRMGGSTSG